MRRLRALWRRYGPRCGDRGPWWRITHGACIAPRGHERDGTWQQEWHADGNGFIWTDDRWAWRGEPVSLDDIYAGLGPHERGVFTEGTTE